MYQTAYVDLQSIGRLRVPYSGGFCKWWYTPIQNIASFPAVNPVTQLLNSEPILQAGKTWYGPVTVPDRRLGWEEDLKRVKAGLYYSGKVEGFMPGMDIANHINLQNLAYNQVCIVGRVRSGGFFLILGNDVAGLDLDVNTTSGYSLDGIPGSKLMFTGESINRALILPSFAGISTPPPGTATTGTSGGLTGSGGTPEIIHFTNQTTIDVPYTAARRTSYGDFPLIQIWISDGSSIYLVPGPDISVDLPAPNQTNFQININGPVSGFIILSK